MSELRRDAIDLVVVLISTSSLVHAAARAKWAHTRRMQIVSGGPHRQSHPGF
jgi:2-C-methyl-D-erythritol 4-phosphate cytidylyltransferase